MPKIDLKSIKAASIKAVFQAIADREKSTRAEIAQATGLSLMTVGKIAESFSVLGITKEEKEASSAVGRRASVIRITDTYYTILIDLTTDLFGCEIMNAGTSTIDRFSYACSRNFYPDENLLLFLKNLSLYLNNRYFPEFCMGIGVVLPDNPSSVIGEALKNLHPYLNHTLSGFATHIITETQTEAAAFYSTYKHPKSAGHILLYCRPCSDMASALVIDGNVIKGRSHAVGSIAAWADAYLPGHSQDAEKAVQLIESASRLLDPHEIILESDASGEKLMQLIADRLFKTDVEHPSIHVSFGGSRNACVGIAIKLRERWLHRIIAREI